MEEIFWAVIGFFIEPVGIPCTMNSFFGVNKKNVFLINFHDNNSINVMSDPIWAIIGVIVGIFVEKIWDWLSEKRRFIREYKREINRKKIEAYQKIISEMVMFERYCRDILYKSILEEKIIGMIHDAKIPITEKETFTKFIFDLHGFGKKETSDFIFVPLDFLNDLRNRILDHIIFCSDEIERDIEDFLNMTAKFDYLRSSQEKLKTDVDKIESFTSELIKKCKKEIYEIKNILK
jgi:hypothetical protein